MLNNVNEKPEATRKIIVWVAVVITMAFVVGIWVISLQQGALSAKNINGEEQINEQSQEEQTETLESILSNEQEQFDELLQNGAKADEETQNEQAPEQLPSTDLKVIKPGEENQEESSREAEMNSEESAEPSISPTTTPIPSLTTTPTP